MNHPRTEGSTGPTPWKASVGIVLMCVALYGLALVPRLAGGAQESLWWDEYTSVTHLDAPSLAAFLRLNRTLDPATLPLYYSLEYLWWQYVSADAFGLRLLSALLNAWTAPLLFLILRPRAGWIGGLVAALCFVLSPVHGQHGMGIRMYALFVPLAALSMGAWLESLRTDPGSSVRGRRIALLTWAVATLALSWTHPFAPLVAMVQGVHLFFARPRAIRLWLARGLLMAVLIAPSLAYVASVRFWPRETTESWMRAPDLFQVIADILWDDVPRWTWQVEWGSWGRSLDAATHLPVTGAVALWYAVTAVAVVGHFLLLRFRRAGTPDLRFSTGLLLAWLVLPPLALYGLSLAWRPCMMPRYSVHASLALYLLCGLAMEGQAGRSGRVAAAGLLSGLMLCSLLTWPGPWRTDWRGPARLLAREARPEKDALVVVNHTWRDVFLLNVRLDPDIRTWTLPTAAAETPEALRAVMNWWRYWQATTHDPAPDAALWVLVAGDYFSDTPPEPVTAVLREFPGTQQPRAVFPTVEPLWLWRVPAETASFESLPGDGDPIPRNLAADLDHEIMRALGDYALAMGLAKHVEEALALLHALQTRSAFAGELYAGLVDALTAGNTDESRQAGLAIRKMWDSYGYLKNGHEDLAREGFAEAARLDARNGLACLEAGLLSVTVQPEAAKTLLEEAVQRRPDYGPVTRRLRETLAFREPAVTAKVLAATRAFRDGLAAMGRGDAFQAAQRLRETLELDPDFREALPPLAYALTLTGDTRGAWDTLDACDRAGLGRDPGVLGNRVLLALMRGDFEEAERWYQDATAVVPDLAAKYDGLFRALFEGKRDLAREQVRNLERQGIPIPPPLREILEKHENTAP